MDDRQPIADHLTQRELKILELLTDGLSNQAIAEQLFITLGTVKWHLKQIYSKLHVSSRTQAIASAREFGLLQATPAKAGLSTPPHNLPQQLTLFIGRTEEQVAITRLLENPNCRLLTVIGPGGIGKTRLALQVADQQIPAFAQGVYFISLAPLSTSESIIPALAEAMHFSFYPDVEPKLLLLDYLRTKQILLLLDNFEHLLAAVSLVTEILEAAPKVKILVTSRERLNVQGETLFALGGMAYPSQESMQDVIEYSAVKLFLQTATQVQPDFPLTDSNLISVADICRQVQGMPLGILLAASWVAVLSVQEIALEIQKSLDFLETGQRDIPVRQRSLRAAFDHSWKLLTEDERNAFKRFSVFRGGFTRDAAEQVTETSLKVLMALVNKSLLYRDAVSGRYEIHELLRQYGQEQLNNSPEEMENTQDLHAAYYADYMQRQWKAMMSPRQGAIFDEISFEINNVLKAWNYAVEKHKASVFRAMTLGMWYFCDFRMSRPESGKLFGRAAEALAASLTDRETEIALGQILAIRGWIYTDGLPNPPLGKAWLEQSLSILRQHNDCPEEMVVALNALACVCGFVMGQFSEGLQAAQEGLRIAREHHIQWGISHCLLQLGYCLYAQGDLMQAKQIGEEGARISESIGDVWLMSGTAVHLLGLVAIAMKDYAEAERQFEYGIRWYMTLDEHCWGIAVACAQLGKVALLTQDFGKAKIWLQQSLNHHLQTGRREREYYEALYDLSRFFVAQGRQETAIKMLTMVQHQEAAWSVRDLATTFLSELQVAVPTEIDTSAVNSAEAFNIDMIVAQFLAS